MDNMKECDRCGVNSDAISVMSWFTTEMICEHCKALERQVQVQLPNQGMEFEGCGFIPEITLDIKEEK